MKKQWNYVEKDGNPKMAGLYWVTPVSYTHLTLPTT